MDSRLIKPYPKPSLLKDYLLDDMSSCSSNGFKSFPRKQCCSSVRFIHEFDRKNKQLQHQQKHKIYLNSNKPPSRSAFSALQSVITAVKRLPFSTSKPLEKKKSNDSFFARSFSKKILKKSYFWKRKSDRKEIVRLKSFDQLLKDDPNSDRSITTTVSKSNSWSESDFTVSTDNFSGGNSSSEVNLNLPSEKNGGMKMPVEVGNDNGVGVTNGDVTTDSTTCSDGSGTADNNSKKQWSGGEKEQLSPVSVLDCPFDDEDEVSSPFQQRLARMEGSKKKLLQKIQRLECLASLEPVNLTIRFAVEAESDNESCMDEKEDEKAVELLDEMKMSMPCYAVSADKLLLDFFRERISGSGVIEEARDWIKGEKCWVMEWEKQKNRQAYVEDMEKGGEWKSLDKEIQEVGLELENELFGGLLNELLLDIMPTF